MRKQAYILVAVLIAVIGMAAFAAESASAAPTGTAVPAMVQAFVPTQVGHILHDSTLGTKCVNNTISGVYGFTSFGSGDHSATGTVKVGANGQTKSGPLSGTGNNWSDTLAADGTYYGFQTVTTSDSWDHPDGGGHAGPQTFTVDCGPAPPVCPQGNAAVSTHSLAIVNGVATETFTVAAGCTHIQVGLASYTAANGRNFPDNLPQTIYGSPDVEYFNAGPGILHVNVPDCFAQTDAFLGDVIVNLSADNRYGSRLLDGKITGDKSCETPPPATYNVSVIKDCKDAAGNLLPSCPSGLFPFTVTCTGGADQQPVLWSSNPQTVGSCLTTVGGKVCEPATTGDWKNDGALCVSFGPSTSAVTLHFVNKEIPGTTTTVPGPPGNTGPAGPPGTGIPGAPGQGATVTQLPVGDTHCPNGGASITGSNGTVYVCSGSNGAAGSNGTGTAGAPGKNGSVTVTIKCGSVKKVVHVSGSNTSVTIKCPAAKSKKHPKKIVKTSHRDTLSAKKVAAKHKR